MKIQLGVPWKFKERACSELVGESIKRASRFTDIKLVSYDAAKPEKISGKIWLCHSAKQSKLFSSEELAQKIQSLQNQGIRELSVLIGPADGFTAGQIQTIKPELLWSFGPMTLPHELAAVVAAEQLYRTFAILNNHPYHAGH